MSRICFVMLLLFCAGCLTSRFEYDHDDVVKYLKKNPGVPPNIQKSLHEGRLEVGMNMEEVKLCWGKPSSEKISEPPDPVQTVWKYTQSDNSWKNLPSSPHWERQIPMYTATFGPDLRLRTWHVYGKEQTRTKTAAAKRNPRKRPAKKSSKPTAPSSDKIKWADKDDIAHWPVFDFTSVLVAGTSRSVVINGRPLDEGERILGIKILKIYPEGAKMQYGQEVLYLKKGITTR